MGAQEGSSLGGLPSTHGGSARSRALARAPALPGVGPPVTPALSRVRLLGSRRPTVGPHTRRTPETRVPRGAQQNPQQDISSDTSGTRRDSVPGARGATDLTGWTQDTHPTAHVSVVTRLPRSSQWEGHQHPVQSITGPASHHHARLGRSPACPCCEGQALGHPECPCPLSPSSTGPG